MRENYTSKDVSRFWKKVDKSGECWRWTAARAGGGYGHMRWRNNKYEYAHRISYEIAFGKIPENMIICHHCDNPDCVKPSHLFCGTQQDNMNDKVKKGRQRKGETVPNAKLTNKQAKEIRERYSKEHITQKELAELYGVSQERIWSLLIGNSYRAGENKIQYKKHLPSGEKNPNSKLTKKQVEKIRHIYSTRKMSYQRLSEMFGVGKTTIAYIVKKKSWKD